MKAQEMTEMLRIERSKVTNVLVKLQERMRFQEKRLKIKYFEDICRRPFLPRHNFDRSDLLRYMHLANAKMDLENHEVVTQQKAVRDAIMTSIAILLRVALIGLNVGILCFFYRMKRRIFTGTLFAVRFCTVLVSLLYRCEAADVLLTVADCDNIQRVRMKEKAEILLNAVCLFIDLVVLSSDIFTFYASILYLVTITFNYISIWRIFDARSYKRLGFLKLISVLKIIVLVLVMEYILAAILFTTACPTILIEWGFKMNVKAEKIQKYSTVKKQVLFIQETPNDQNEEAIWELIKNTGNAVPLAVSEKTDHICHVYGWWWNHHSHIKYDKFIETDIWTQMMLSYYFAVITSTNVGLKGMAPMSYNEKMVVMLVAVFGVMFFMIIGNIISSYLVNEDVELSTWRQQLYVRTKHLNWHGVSKRTVDNLKRLYNYTWRMTRGKDLNKTMSEMNTYQQGEISYALYCQYLKNLRCVPKERDAKEDPDLREAYRTCSKMVCAAAKPFFYNKDSIILKRNDLSKQVLIVQDGEVKTLRAVTGDSQYEDMQGFKFQKVILFSKDIVHDYDPFYGIVSNDIIANTDCKLLSIDFQEIENALIKTGIHISGAIDYESTEDLADSESGEHEAEEVFMASTPSPLEERKAMAAFIKRKKKETENEYDARKYEGRSAEKEYYYYYDRDNVKQKRRREKSNKSSEDDEESSDSDDDSYDDSDDDVTKKNWYLTMRRSLKNSLFVIIFMRLNLYSLYLVSPFCYVIEITNKWAVVGIVCCCCAVCLLELIFVEPYVTLPLKFQVPKYLMQIISVVPFECTHHFLNSTSRTLLYLELVYALVFRFIFLIYRFHDISDALNSFLGLGNVLVGFLQQVMNGFLFYHTMTFFFIGATCLFKRMCDRDTLIGDANYNFSKVNIATIQDTGAKIYFNTLYFVISVTTFAGFGDLSPLTLLETQLAMIMAIFGRMHAAYMMGVIASLFAFGVNKKTKYYDESKRLKIELDLILRSGEDKVGLTSYERKNIAKYADLGWNLTEGIHMSSPDIYRNTPFAINAAEKVELYKSFLLKILKQSEYEEKINQLRRSEFTTFRNTNEARRSVMRILCFEVEEQFLLAGTTLRQQHPIKWYSMVKKGEIISNRTNEPERGLLFDGKYKVSSSCLLLLMPRNQCDTLIQDYVSRATGQLLESEESEQSVGSGGSVNYSSSSTSSDQLIEPLPKTSGERERQKQKEQQGKKEHDENIERLKQKRKEELKKEVGKPRLSPSEYSSVQGSSYRGTVKSSGSVGEYWKPDDVKKEYQRSSRNRRRSSHSGRASSSPSYTEEQLR